MTVNSPLGYESAIFVWHPGENRDPGSIICSIPQLVMNRFQGFEINTHGF